MIKCLLHRTFESIDFSQKCNDEVEYILSTESYDEEKEGDR